MKRRYGEWAGAPKGYPEDMARCVVQVSRGPRSYLFGQCTRARGKGTAPYEGLLCGTHARQQALGRYLSIPEGE